MRWSSLNIAFWFTLTTAVGCDSDLKVVTQEIADPDQDSDDPQPEGSKFTTANCIDPDLKFLATTQSVTLCDGTLAKGTLEISQIAPSKCSYDGETDCVTTDSFKAADMANVLPHAVSAGVTIAGVSGTAVVESHTACVADGSVGCVTTASFKAADMAQASSSNIKLGATLAGVVGSYSGSTSSCSVDGEMGCIVMGPAFRAADTNLAIPGNIKAGASVAGVSGNYGPACTADGGSSCLTDGVSYKAAKLSNFSAADVKTGVTVAGVSGSATLESHSPCAADGDTACVANASFKAVDMSIAVPANIKVGVTLAGTTGAYPSVANPLAGATATADLVSLDATTAAGSYEFFDASGNRYIGSISDAGTVTPGTSDQLFNTSLYRQFTVQGSASLVGGNIKSGTSIFGVAGTLTGAPANCSANAEVGCVTTSTFKAADLSNLLPANIKTGIVLAGTTGGYPSVTYPLAGADGTTDLPAFASTAGGTTYEWFKADGTRMTDAILANETVTPHTANQTLNAGLYRSVTVEGDPDLVAGKIENGITIFGVTGTVVPSASNCSSDGELGCVTNVSFVAANAANLIPSNIKDTIVIGGVTGTLSGSPANCSANGSVGCVTTSTYKSADLTNLTAGNIKNGVTIAGTAGTYPSLVTPLAGATGTSDLTSMAANTPAGSYEFFDSVGTRYTGSITDAGTVTPGTSTQSFATSLYRQFTVSGDVDLAAGNIKSAVDIFGVTGTVTPAPSDCTADGITGCVTTSTYISANTSAYSASDIKSGKTVGGVAGSIATCSGDGTVGCITTASYKSANMTNVTAGNIKSGVTIAGQIGDYPSATNPLAGHTATTDLPSLAATVAAGSYEWFKSDGTLLSGSITDAGTITPGTANQTLNASVYRQFTVAGDSDLVAGNIKTAINIFGVTGTVIVETHSDCTGNAQTGCTTTATYKSGDLTNLSAANIKSGVTIAGTAGDYPSATNPLTGADSTADLDLATFNAKIKSAASFEWFNSSGTRYTNSGDADITAANIANGVVVFGTTGTLSPGSDCTADGQTGCLTTSQYKSANTSAYTAWDVRKGKTIGGKAGAFTLYKNMIGSFNYSTAPAVAGNDVWDTVDDDNDGGAFPTTAPAGWDQATGANWIMDSTNDTGVGAGGVASDGLCNGTEACVFKDQVTGLLWAKDNNGTYSWTAAISMCDNLSYGGYTDWRLPTQKELMQAYIDGIMTQQGATKLGITTGTTSSDKYKSATTNSGSTSYQSVVTMPTGVTDDGVTKSYASRVLCVRP